MKSLKIVGAVFWALLGIASSVTAVYAVTPAERQALIALYNATNGDGWTNNSGWKTPPLDPDGFAAAGTEASWYGFRPGPGGTVGGISLENNNLTGSLPAELGSLNNLQYLLLGGNALSGSLPSELGNCVELLNLFLYSNQISGSLPPELGSLTKLQKLWLGGNQLSGPIPAELGGMTALLELEINSCKLSGPIPSELGNLANLTSMVLSGNQMSGPIPASLGNLANLVSLDLSGNQLDGSLPEDLGNLASLRNLNISQNKLTSSIPASFGDLASLQTLALNVNGLNGPIPAELGNLANLTSMVLSANQLSGPIPASLGGLANLLSLDLGGNQLDGSLPEELGNLASLRDLNISQNKLTGSIPTSFGNLASLLILALNVNSLSGSIPAELGNLTSLQWLYLANNQLSGSIPAELGNMTSLQRILLRNNQLSGPIPAELGNLVNLVYLWLESNLLSGSIPPELGNLSSLDILSLEGNQLTGSIPPELANLTSLSQINLNYNQLSGSIPPELGNMANLQWLGMRFNQLTGALPPELGNLANLTTLDFCNNGLSGPIPPELCNLSNLRILNLDCAGNINGPIPPEIGNLKNLQIIDFTGSGFTGSIPAELGNLTNMEGISIGSPYITGTLPPEMVNMTRLRSLWLILGQVSGPIPAWLGSMTSLQDLRIGYSPFSGPIPAELGNLTNLYCLMLGFNRLSGPIPSSLANLVNLDPAQIGGNLLGYNALYTTDADLIAFLNSKDPTWASTQTVAPTGVAAIGTGATSVQVSWTPITFSAGGGGYRVYWASASGGPYTFAGQTPNKSTTSISVTGLTPATVHYFVVRTRTEFELYLLDSENSEEASGATLAQALITGTAQTTEGSPLAGVVMSGLPGNPVTNASGLYTGFVELGWSGTVTPTLAGHVFSPISTDYTNVTSDQTTNYTASLIQCTVSGQVTSGGNPLSGVEMQISTGGSVMTDGSGNYSFIQNYGWSGTVTPAKSGYTFMPSSRTYSSISGSETGQDYTGSPLTHAISGTVAVDSNPLASVLMSGLPGNPPTDSSGQYTANVESGWSGTVTPILQDHVFSPPSKIYSNVTSTQSGQDYSGAYDPEVTSDYIYWTNWNTGSIGKAKRDGTEVIQSYISGSNRATEIAVTGSYIYWTNYIAGTIGRANLDGTGVDQNWITGCASPWGLAVDANYVYWTSDSGKVGRANLDGSSPNHSWITGCLSPRGLDLDHNYLYWTNEGYSSIGRAKLDGSGVSQNWITGCKQPHGLKVTTAYVYWTNLTDGTVGRAYIDGTSPSQSLVSGCSASTGIDADPSYLYWANFGSTYLGRANRDGSGINQTWISGCSSPVSVVVGPGTPNSCQISGMVTVGGSPLAGVLLSGLPGDPSTDVSGSYTATVSYGWSGTVIPSHVGYIFAPISTNYTNVTSDQTTNYTASLIQCTVSGQVTSGGNPLSGVEMQISTGGSVTTDGSGNYSFIQSYGWSGTVTPVKSGYNFSPLSRTYSGLTGSETGQDYTGGLLTYSVSGTITAYAQPLSGVTMGGLPGSPTSDASGNYTATVNYGWSGTATPALSGYLFTPASKDYSSVASDQTSQDYAATSTSAIPQVEREALIALYNSTNGDSWTNKSGWKTAPLHSDGFALPGTEGTWHAVTVTSSHVTSLNFNTANNLSGSLPTSLGQLTALKTLRLSYTTNVSGSLPAELGNLANLETLVIQFSGLSGNIPAQLGNLASLKTLDLEFGQWSGSIPAELGNLSNLTLLNLNGNKLSGSIPPELGNLTKLAQLDLFSNRLTGTIPSQLGNLTELRFLDLYANQLDGAIPSSLGNLTKLLYLQLFNNKLTGSIPAELGNLTLLQKLWLSDNQLSGAIPVEIGNLSALSQLSLARNRISGNIPVQLGSLANLTTFEFQSNMALGAIPPAFQNLTKLSTLDLGYNGLYAGDSGLITFLNAKDADWAATQTIAPSNVAATPVNSTAVNLSWDAIAYIGDTGGYRISVETSSGGPYTFYQQTANKSATSMQVTGLTPGTIYYFVVQTRTDAHGNQQNTVDSENSAEATTTTIPAYTVTFIEGAGGTISGTKVQVVDQGGSTSAVEAAGNTGYHFVNWTGDYAGADNPLTITNVTANMNVTANFVLNTYTISGTITAGGNPLANVTVSDLPGNPATNASGYYAASVNYDWSGTVTPTLAGYTFTPANRTYSNVAADATFQDYTATLNAYTISGTVTLSGEPLQNVVMNSLPGNPETNASGVYTGTVTYGWSGTVTPTLAGYAFTPDNRTYSDVQADATAQDYTAVLNAYTVSGTITLSGNPLQDVVMSGLPGNPLTNSSGYYSASVDHGWSGTVTPTLSWYTFAPVSRTYTNVTANQTAQDYAATAVSGVTVLSPNGGEYWGRGITQTITWSYSGAIGTKVKILLYKGTALAKTLTVGTPTANCYFNWTVPAAQALGTNYTIRITSTTNASYTDMSDTPFNIVAESFTLTAPNGGEKLIAGTTSTITWTYKGVPGANVKLELLKAGAYDSTITLSTPVGAAGKGSFGWAIPSLQAFGKDYSVKISSVTNAGIFDTSNAVFMIYTGLAKSWGSNTAGELGDGGTTNSNVPVSVSSLSTVKALSAGRNFSLALKSDGSARAWGLNDKGQLGNSTNTNSGYPVQVSGLSGVTNIAAGGSFALALKSTGLISSWGENGDGQLGNAKTLDSNVPVAVFGTTKYKAVAAGDIHAAALAMDGTVRTWGSNYYGQLGIGTSGTISSKPVKVLSLTLVTSVAAGVGHTAALKKDGTVWVWGDGQYGQLGNGTNNRATRAVKTLNITGITAIAAGGYHMTALKSDGTVWTWGLNDKGQLGNAGNTNSNVPVQASGLGNVAAIAAGGSHTLALKSNGTVWAWGYNSSGQLGNASFIDSNVPVQVGSLIDVVTFAAGYAHTLALK